MAGNYWLLLLRRSKIWMGILAIKLQKAVHTIYEASFRLDVRLPEMLFYCWQVPFMLVGFF